MCAGIGGKVRHCKKARCHGGELTNFDALTAEQKVELISPIASAAVDAMLTKNAVKVIPSKYYFATKEQKAELTDLRMSKEDAQFAVGNSLYRLNERFTLAGTDANFASIPDLHNRYILFSAVAEIVVRHRQAVPFMVKEDVKKEGVPLMWTGTDGETPVVIPANAPGEAWKANATVEVRAYAETNCNEFWGADTSRSGITTQLASDLVEAVNKNLNNTFADEKVDKSRQQRAALINSVSSASISSQKAAAAAVDNVAAVRKFADTLLTRIQVLEQRVRDLTNGAADAEDAPAGAAAATPERQAQLQLARFETLHNTAPKAKKPPPKHTLPKTTAARMKEVENAKKKHRVESESSSSAETSSSSSSSSDEE